MNRGKLKKRVQAVLLAVAFALTAVTGAGAATLVVSSDNLDFSQPLQVLSNPATTLQIGYDFNVYHNWLCVDLRGRSAQQSDSESLSLDTDTGIINDRITVLPSLDAGVRVKLAHGHVIPYLFSLLNYTTINSSFVSQDHRTSEDVSALGLRAGAGMDILLQTQTPAWLFNVDTGYQYLHVPLTNVGIVSLSGIFVSLGFGLSF